MVAILRRHGLWFVSLAVIAAFEFVRVAPVGAAFLQRLAICDSTNFTTCVDTTGNKLAITGAVSITGTPTVSLTGIASVSLVNRPSMDAAQLGAWAITDLKDSGGTTMTDTTFHGLNVVVKNGSGTGADAATRTGGNATVAEVNSNVSNWSGEAWERVRNCRFSVTVNNSSSFALVSGVAAKQIYICDVDLVVASSVSISLVEGAGTPCTIGASAVLGAATTNSSNGMQFATQSGISKNYQGRLRTRTAANALCLYTSGSVLISGVVTYTQE